MHFGTVTVAVTGTITLTLTLTQAKSSMMAVGINCSSDVVDVDEAVDDVKYTDRLKLTVTKFLNRLLGVESKLQNEIFNFFVNQVTTFQHPK